VERRAISKSAAAVVGVFLIGLVAPPGCLMPGEGDWDCTSGGTRSCKWFSDAQCRTVNGCEVGVGGCSRRSCFDNTSEDACNSMSYTDYCLWNQDSRCLSSAASASCDATDSETCLADPACVWLPLCGGTPASCSNYDDETSCEAQFCKWEQRSNG